MADPMKREDYTDPNCPFDSSQYEKEPPVITVPLMRILEKEDEFLARNDPAGAERLLLYWVREAEAGHDRKGLFILKNELMGHYRKESREQEALAAIEDARALLPAVGEDSAAAGTFYVNAATVLKAFGRPSDALPLFLRAEEIYGETLPPDDPRLGGLYNNEALACADLGQYGRALGLYEKALSVMEKTGNGYPEMAVTCLNMADLVSLRDGPETGEAEIFALLDRAEALLERPDIPRDGNYAFVLSKCAPVFDAYGRFLYAAEISERARNIYARQGESAEE